MLAGVCEGIGRRLRVDPVLLRVAFVVATMAGGAGLLAYLLAWAAIPATASPHPAADSARRGSWRVVAGIGLLTLSALLLLRALGIWAGDAAVWPVALAASGATLIWRQSQRSGAAGPEPAPRAPRTPAAAPAQAVDRADRDFSGRVILGAALVVGGGLVFLWLVDALRPARDVILAVVVVVVASALILAPWWVRLARGLAAERAARIRNQERAEVAAHLHDSVLQTLALVQQRAQDPRAVASLARRQERELRAWLSGTRPPGAGATLAAALERAAADVEEAHGTPIEVVTVGDCPLDDRVEALAAAAREALVNAAKFAPDATVSLYAEVGPGRLQVFVRDRGPGFDAAAIPADRRGIRESIVGRMARHGGHAEIHSGPGAGTEVELTLERQR
jgi:signal transduction histidine kinase/phage shock protein PspC (stress-responsive transcriptional regulator)